MRGPTRPPYRGRLTWLGERARTAPSRRAGAVAAACTQGKRTQHGKPQGVVRDQPITAGPLRHPRAPGLSLAGIRLAVPGHAKGLPVLRALSLCTCCRHCPGAAAGRRLRSFVQPYISLPRYGGRVGPRIVLFEACSAFTHVAACTLALSPIRDTLIEGFSHLVTSMTAPIAFRLERIAGWDLHPLESAALSRRTPKGNIFLLRICF